MLTEKEVKERATSPEKALDVSIQHWQENVCMTEEEAAKRDRYSWLYPNNAPVSGTFCGLCAYNQPATQGCKNCILSTKAMGCNEPDSTWKKAVRAWNAYKKGVRHGSFADWTKAAVDMVELLKKLKRENYGKKEEKVELGHLDYGYDQDGDPCVMVKHAESLRAVGKIHLAPVDAYYRVVDRRGNILDDLKRNSEPLRESYITGIPARIEGHSICIGNGHYTLTGDNIDFFISDLQRMRATIESEAKK